MPYCVMEVPNGFTILGTLQTLFLKHLFFLQTTIETGKMKAGQKDASIASI